MIFSFHRAVWVLIGVAALGGWAQALEPDQILLVVNKHMPEGEALARFYANARLIPEGRIVSLDLPGTEEMPVGMYERNVVPALRQYLRSNGLEKKITCIVTFYGVPLRIAARANSVRDQEELTALKEESERVTAQIRGVVEGLETKVRQFDKTYVPSPGNDVAGLAQRARKAFDRLGAQAAQSENALLRTQRTDDLVEGVRTLAGPTSVLQSFSAAAQASDEQLRRKFEELGRQVQAMNEQITQLQDQRFDPVARAKLRTLVHEGGGLLELYQALQAQIRYFDTKDTTVAFDSELALLWWDGYARTRWTPNPLHYGLPKVAGPPTLMVMRLDAPQSGMVRDMILASLRAERDGLKGRVVLDSRGMMPPKDKPQSIGGNEWYDQGLRNLAGILKDKTKMPVLLDESPEVLAANSATDVALYCGWYSLMTYVPACKFNLGAVGFHVASFELKSMRNEDGEWVRNLLRDGVVGTLGPVEEPYLVAFPPADEFFPLLLTGKLTLAEVYWKTMLHTSWMITMVGDPLYTPYKNNPQLGVEDLPARLRGALEPAPATGPAGGAPRAGGPR